MSHTVTVTRTTTSTTTSAIIINSGYLKTWPGILKLFQTILGIVAVGLVSYYYDRYYSRYSHVPETFFLLMAVTFLVGTFILLLSCLISLSTGTIISKTVYEVLYHGAAAIMYLAAGLTLLVEVNSKKRNAYAGTYEPYTAAAVIGLVLCILYVFSTIFALRSYRSM